MKTLKKILFVILAVGMLFTSCKKSSAPVSTTYTVKYEVVWTFPLLALPVNQITYTNATGNNETVGNITGTSWTTTITHQTPTAVVLGALLYGTSAGTCTVNIYVNGVLKSTNSTTNTGAYAYNVVAGYNL